MLSGTFLGPFLDIQPTGRGMSCSAAGVYRLVDAKIADDWRYDELVYTLLRFESSHA
ncbi:SnoaL-like polyketide cyclase [compost metagenome]